MSNSAAQKVLLNATDCLKVQYHFLSDPCLALVISRHYRLLANCNDDMAKRKSYLRKAEIWLSLYINHRNYSPKLQSHLADFVLLHEFN